MSIQRNNGAGGQFRKMKGLASAAAAQIKNERHGRQFTQKESAFAAEFRLPGPCLGNDSKTSKKSCEK